jgi:hypothetical protein
MKILIHIFTRTTILTLIVVLFITDSLQSQDKAEYKLQNPITVSYLKKNLQKQSPRLVLNKEIEKNLRAKLKTDPLVQNIYKTIKYNAEEVLTRDLITLDIPENPASQKNQLGISRDFLFRVNMLAMVYRIEKDQRMLNRLNDEVIAACNFPSWNPKHFLDVGEMSLAIALRSTGQPVTCQNQPGFGKKIINRKRHKTKLARKRKHAFVGK